MYLPRHRLRCLPLRYETTLGILRQYRPPARETFSAAMLKFKVKSALREILLSVVALKAELFRKAR